MAIACFTVSPFLVLDLLSLSTSQKGAFCAALAVCKGQIMCVYVYIYIYIYENIAKEVNVVNNQKWILKSKYTQKNLNEKYYQHSTPFRKCTGHTSNKVDSRSLDIIPTRIGGSP